MSTLIEKLTDLADELLYTVDTWDDQQDTPSDLRDWHSRLKTIIDGVQNLGFTLDHLRTTISDKDKVIEELSKALENDKNQTDATKDYYLQRPLKERILNRFEGGGPHLGEVRRWIQWTFNNGSYVTWGTDDQLGNSGLTVRQMERLVERIKDVVIRDVLNEVEKENV